MRPGTIPGPSGGQDRTHLVRQNWSIGRNAPCRLRIVSRLVEDRKFVSRHSPSRSQLIARPAIHHLAGFARGRLRRRNPGPPPFSSMNSTPAISNGTPKSPARPASLKALPGLIKRQEHPIRLTLPVFAVERAVHITPDAWVSLRLRSARRGSFSTRLPISRCAKRSS